MAAVAALLAGVAILAYLNRYRENLQAGATPMTVLIARQTIPKGTPGSVVASKGLLTATTIRESQLREGAFSDPASLTGRVATREIYEGSQLTVADFSATASSLAGTLTERERILTIPLDTAHGLIGKVEEGNRVDVYAGFNVQALRADGSPVEGVPVRAVLKRILSNVPVIRVDESAAGVGARTTNVGLLVNDKEAGDLAFSSDNGKIWLSLRPSAGAKSTKPALVTVETVLLGARPMVIQRSLGGR